MPAGQERVRDERFLRSRALWVSIALTLTGCALVLFWFAHEENAPQPVGVRAEEVAGAESASPARLQDAGAEPLEVESRTEVAGLERGGCTVRVLDERDRTPIEGARVVAVSGANRTLEAANSKLLGHADRNGALRIDCDALASYTSLAVHAQGYVCAELDVPALADGQEDVLLRPGAALTVRCIDAAGTPITDGVAFASRRPLPPDTECRRIHAGAAWSAPGAAGVVWGELDDEGRAALGPIDPGEYFLGVHVPGFAVLELRPGSKVVVPSSGTWAEVVLAPVYGLVLEVEGDDVVTSGIEHVSFAKSSRQWSVLAAERELLVQRFPGAQCATFLIAQPDWADQPAQVALLLCRSGAMQVAAPLFPTRSIAAPQVVVAGDVSASGNCATVPVTLRDAAGASLREGLFSLQSPAGDVILLEEGELSLPEGSYEVVCSDPRLEGRFQPTHVRVPDPIHVRVDVPLIACRLEVRDGEGLRLERYQLSILSADRRSMQVITDAALATEQLLPPGPATITVTAAGFEPTSVQVHIVPDGGPQSIPIVLAGG